MDNRISLHDPIKRTEEAGSEDFAVESEVTQNYDEEYGRRDSKGADDLLVLEHALLRHPLHREILYKILAFCENRKSLEEIEAEIASYPEFGQATQNQYHLINVLERSGGLVRLEFDEEGNEVREARKEGLSDDEIDDLIACYAFETTACGNQIVAQHTPLKRMIELLDIHPERKSTYIEVLERCNDHPCTYKELEGLLKGRFVLRTGHGDSHQPIQPSVFLDKLEKAAGVAWDDGWQLTRWGKEILDELKK